MKKMMLGIAVGLVSVSLFAGDFDKGSPVLVVTKEKSYAGKLESAVDANPIKIKTDKKIISISKSKVKAVRSLANMGISDYLPSQKAKGAYTTRGGLSGYSQEDLKAQFRTAYLERDCKDSYGNRVSRAQILTDSIHPCSTVTDVRIHEVSDSTSQLVIRYTLFWEGPITKDGYTKIRAVYDNEIKRWVETKIEATNGITNSDLVIGGIITILDILNSGS